jgi:putative aldouronate transport system substrate-binding protein
MESKNQSRRSFLRAAGVAMTGAVLAACGATPTATPTKVPPTNTPVPPPPATATKAPAAATAAPAAPTAVPPTAVPPTPTKPPVVTISYGIFVMSAQDPAANADSKIQKWMESTYNVKLNFRWIERFQAKDIYATLFAAGDTPDVFHYETTGQPLIDQKIVGEVAPATIKKYAPKYFKSINDYNVLAWISSIYQGKCYGWPLMGPNNLIPFTEGWRMDSLEKVGITKVPETLVEVEDAFTKIVAQKVHPYGVISRAKDAPQMMFGAIFGAFGTFPNMWIENDDKAGVGYGPTLDSAKEAMTLLQSWYKKGFIHPETATSGWQQCVNTWCQGKTAVTDVATWYRLYKGGELYDCVVDAGGKIALAYPPKGPKGKQGYYGWGYANPPVRFSSKMTADMTKLGRLLEMYDGVACDVKNGYFVRYGDEGVDSARDEWGVPQIKKETDRAKVGTSIGLLMPSNYQVFESIQRKDYADLTKYAKTNNISFIRDLGAFINPDVSKVQGDLNLIQGKWTMNFISGSASMDKWGDFLKEWNDAGGKALVTDAQRAYKSMNDDLNSLKDQISKA